MLNRNFIGIEKEKEFFEMSIARKNELENNRTQIFNKIKDLKLLNNKAVNL
ncbi:DNA methylase [Campylobacter geochelonis]|nr:DNA methylase [Campylobacter geochelonis]CZE50938.1 DNA methylase [Campylobacter geochelonis]